MAKRHKDDMDATDGKEMMFGGKRGKGRKKGRKGKRKGGRY